MCYMATESDCDGTPCEKCEGDFVTLQPGKVVSIEGKIEHGLRCLCAYLKDSLERRSGYGGMLQDSKMGKCMS